MTSKARLPETLSIKDLAQQMEKQGRIPSRPSDVADRRARLAAHSLAIRGPDNAAAGLQPGKDVDGWMMVRCTEIECYDRNPRVRTNPRYAEIRASIQTRGGLSEALSVTRRPGASRYMCYMGGNTRLRIVQDLWQETKDPRYEWVRVVFHPWVSESDVIAAHLIENELRADTTFWEKARGVATLKAELEADEGGPLSLRALSDHARACGLKLHAVTAANYLFAVDHLAPFGAHLTHESAGAIRSRHGHLEKLAEALNLDPYVRRTEFQQLVADAATEINAIRDQDDPPRVTPAELDMILSRMNAQFARQANCTVSAVEQTLFAVMGAEKQLPASEIRARLSGCSPAANPPPTGPAPSKDADVENVPQTDGGAAVPPPDRTTRKSRAGGRTASREATDAPAFTAAVSRFAEPFRIAAAVRAEDGKTHGFSVDPLKDSDEPAGALECQARQAAHQLLARLAGDSAALDAEAQDVLVLLLQPKFWPLTRALIDAYHSQSRSGGPR